MAPPADTRQRPRPLCASTQVRAAVPVMEPPFPAADALMVTGPPVATQVAIPVEESTVAMVASEDVHCAGKFVWVLGD